MRNGFVSDEQYQHSLAVFKELLDADVYESGNKKIIEKFESAGNDSNLLIVFYVQIMPDDFVMQLHRF